MRFVFIAVGLFALGCSAFASLEAGAAAPVIVGLAAVLAVGSAAVGYALSSKHYGLAGIIALGLVAGDAGAMLQTAQRVTAAREAVRAPLAKKELERKAALTELSEAQAASPEPVSHERLTKAETAKAAADQAARDKSAEKGCRENCRLLLQAAVDSAAKEVDAARAEIASLESTQADKIADRIASAKAAVALMPAPQSSTPLADNIGIREWALDTLEAVLLAFAANLPASALIALGVKLCGRSQNSAIVQTAKQAILEATTVDEIKAAPAVEGRLTALPAPRRSQAKRKSAKPRTTRNAASEAEQFGVAMLRPSEGAQLNPGELRQAYLTWCDTDKREPLPMTEIAPALGRLFKAANIPVVGNVAHGVAVRKPDQIEAA